MPKHWLPEALKPLKNLQANLRYCLGVQRVRWSPGVSLFHPWIDDCITSEDDPKPTLSFDNLQQTFYSGVY